MPTSRLCGGELGDCLGALRDGVLCKLSRERQADCRLDLTGRKRCLLVVADEFASLSHDLVKDVVDK